MLVDDVICRNDFQVKLRGYRIELGEIEAVILQFSNVSNVCVKLLKVNNTDCLVAYVAGLGDGYDDVIVGKIRAYVASKVAEYMVPSYFVLLSELTTNNNGKIDAKALPPPATSSPAANITKSLSSTSSLHTQIQEIISGLLWTDSGNRIDLEVNFFTLGFHSLLAVEATTIIRRDLSYNISVADVFMHPTVNSLCAHIIGMNSGRKSPDDGASQLSNSVVSSSNSLHSGVLSHGASSVSSKITSEQWTHAIMTSPHFKISASKMTRDEVECRLEAGYDSSPSAYFLHKHSDDVYTRVKHGYNVSGKLTTLITQTCAMMLLTILLGV